MSIIVTKSPPVLVGPATAPAAPATEHINLSSFDKPLAFLPSTSFHIFTHAIHSPAETVRSALSRALVHYFPIAGRIVAGGELRIACTGEGVAFVAASANCSLEDVKLFDPPFATLLKELAVGLGPELFGPSDPLLLVQVTEFSCGGFVVAVTRNHGVADATGFAQFLQAVGELARGLPQPTVLPVISCGDGSLRELPPVMTAVMKKASTLKRHQDYAYLDTTITSSCINRVKAGFAAAGDGDEPCTVFDAVMAVLWQCRTRAAVLSSGDPSAHAPLVFAVSVRKLVGAEEGYYGNCITMAAAVATGGEVASGDISDVVKLIKRAKRQVPSFAAEQLDDVVFGYNALAVTSWRNLGADAVDFGGGTPARVMSYRMEGTRLPTCVMCLPYKGKDGANVLAQCVNKDHVDAFLGELAKLA